MSIEQGKGGGGSPDDKIHRAIENIIAELARIKAIVNDSKLEIHRQQQLNGILDGVEKILTAWCTGKGGGYYPGLQ